MLKFFFLILLLIYFTAEEVFNTDIVNVKVENITSFDELEIKTE